MSRQIIFTGERSPTFITLVSTSWVIITSCLTPMITTAGGTHDTYYESDSTRPSSSRFQEELILVWTPGYQYLFRTINIDVYTYNAPFPPPPHTKEQTTNLLISYSNELFET